LPRALLPRRVVDIIKMHVFCIDKGVRCCRTTAACCGENPPHTATPCRVACSIENQTVRTKTQRMRRRRI